MRLIYYSINEDDLQKGELSEGYDATRNKKPFFNLTVTSAQKNQMAVYLCASSPELGKNTQYFGAGTRLSVIGELGYVFLCWVLGL